MRRMRFFHSFLLLAVLGAAGSGAAQAQLLVAPLASPTALGVLPPEVEALLLRAKVPREALAAIVVDAASSATATRGPLLNFRAAVPMNPASTMKLVTTFAGLELLGPAYTWRTPVYAEGPIAGGVLQGNLIIQGRGDPKLVLERLWLLLRRVQSLGITRITGDIVLDRSAFAVPMQAPGDFDGEPLRPYNALPDALLVNFKTVVMTFTVQPGAGIASITYEPPLAGVQMQASVPLSVGVPGTALAECGDWRTSLKAEFADPLRMAFAGTYPAGCAEKVWPLAYAAPERYAERAIAGIWQEMGGSLGGRVRDGRVPVGLKPVFEMVSPPLADTIRDINKFSNNVMAQQLFMSLSLANNVNPNANVNSNVNSSIASVEASREVLRTWWRERFPASAAANPQEAAAAAMPLFDNGSGLSRTERIAPMAMARLLQAAFASGNMPDLMASLPISGIDGTLRSSRSRIAQGTAHLKTGSLSDVVALAGYLHTAGGRRLVLVATINHPNAAAARPALDALVDWAIKEGNR